MNSIYNKTRPKRKYVRKPLCANLNKICTREKCRCDMAIKAPKTNQKIDDNFLHRQKVIKRRLEIDLQKLDREIDNFSGVPNTLKGYVPPKPVKRHLLLKGFLILLFVAFFYPLAIIVVDLFM